MDHVESTSVGIWVKAGGRYEQPGVVGASHFLEHLLFKGTRSRSCEQLKQAIEGIGGGLNGFTAEEFTCYMAKVPATYLGRAVNVLSDMVLRPALTHRDVEKEREVILEEIRMYQDTPGQYVHEVFNQLLWPNHPLGNFLAGTPETMRAMTRATLRHYWRRMYHPANMVVSCAGAIDCDRVARQVRQIFGRVARRAPQRVIPAPRPPRGPVVQLLHKATEQTHLCFGTPAIARTHPLRFALEALHIVLGANMSSRLFREIREKRGLVYEIGTQIKRYRDTGAFLIYAGCDAGKLRTTIQTVVKELSLIKRCAIPARELRRAKEFYRGQLLIGLEDTMEQMLWIGEQMTTLGRIATPHDVVRAMARVTPQQIQRVARVLFAAHRLFLAVVGPVPEQDATTLKQLCNP